MDPNAKDKFEINIYINRKSELLSLILKGEQS